MDAANIEYLTKVFAQPRVRRALAEVRAAIRVRGDLALGDEGLMISQATDGELIATSFRAELEDSRSESVVVLTEAQRHAADLLWVIGLGNASMVEHLVGELQATEFLASQGDRTAQEFGLRLNGDEGDHLSIYPDPLPKP
ncbi:hypothetical protein [Actinokineospora enzanensis]|uniref:hypothetical protein n=1 Tax=Actinokineospora enzanensis TaxID=155975 RepID=UPI000367312B|nr:hypothetical protein [Actinokineospora enzanensis]